MSFVKYRVKEVAADFGVTPKDIAEIVGKYFEKPRSNTQVLTDEQLNVVFDVITQKHQIASLEQVFAVAPQAKKPEPKKAEAPKPAAQPAQGSAPAANAAPAAQSADKAAKPQQEQRKRERRDKQRKAELHGVCSLFLTFSKFHGDHGTKMFCSSAVMSAT